MRSSSLRAILPSVLFRPSSSCWSWLLSFALSLLVSSSLLRILSLAIVGELPLRLQSSSGGHLDHHFVVVDHLDH
eukprot:8416825-Heterocapsa_arctica.AAC.1